MKANMPKLDSGNQKEKGPNTPAEPNGFNWQRAMLFAIGALLITGYWVTKNGLIESQEKSLPEFYEMLAKDQIVKDPKTPLVLPNTPQVKQLMTLASHCILLVHVCGEEPRDLSRAPMSPPLFSLLCSLLGGDRRPRGWSSWKELGK